MAAGGVSRVNLARGWSAEEKGRTTLCLGSLAVGHFVSHGSPALRAASVLSCSPPPPTPGPVGWLVKDDREQDLLVRKWPGSPKVSCPPTPWWRHPGLRTPTDRGQWASESFFFVMQCHFLARFISPRYFLFKPMLMAVQSNDLTFFKMKGRLRPGRSCRGK